MAETTTTNAQTAADIAGVDVASITDKVLKANVLKAAEACRIRMEANSKRKSTPAGVSAGIEQTDKFTELAKAVCPEAYWRGPRTKANPRGTIPPTKHVYYGLPEKAEVDMGNGKIPVIVNGCQVKCEGMPLYWEPAELYEQRVQGAGSESKTRLTAGAKLAGDIDRDREASAATEEQLSVTTQGG